MPERNCTPKSQYLHKTLDECWLRLTIIYKLDQKVATDLLQKAMEKVVEETRDLHDLYQKRLK